MIEFKNVTKRYGTNVAVDDVSFKINEGEFFILIGPSGCGKTTTLKMINRLIPLSEGYIVDELLDKVRLDPNTYRDRKPDELSGGQRQRVGVVRALAADPPVILMDEPFSALDPISREKLQDDLLELQTKIKKTIIFVTHDIQEAMKLGDRICLLNDGRVEQIDTPEGFQEHPKNQFVREFMGDHLHKDINNYKNTY